MKSTVKDDEGEIMKDVAVMEEKQRKYQENVWSKDLETPWRSIVKLMTTKMLPYPKPIFMMCKTHMADIHDDPLALGDKFEM